MSRKTTGKNQTFIFNGVPITCITSVSLTDQADVIVIDCAGSPRKEKAIGLSDAKYNVAFAIEEDDDVLLNALEPGSAGTVVWHPAGNTSTFIQVDTLVATIASRDMDDPVSGYFSGTCVIEADDVLITPTT